jgi:glycosyltransferase involved in cell wall biosynthesis
MIQTIAPTPALPGEIKPAEQLLVLPLVIRVVGGRVLYDLQSRDSLVRYLNWFDSVIVACPQLAESRVEGVKSFVWVPVDDLLDRVQFVPLPEYGSKWKFLRDYRSTAWLLRRCIEASDYLQFAIGGGNGGLDQDWAAVAAEQAIKAGRKFAMLADAVSFGDAPETENVSLRKRLALRVKRWLIRRWQTRLVARCDLMFCNGLDTYLTYKPMCRTPEMARKINDFQIGPEKFLGPEGVERKCRDALERPELHVCYAGRVEPQKAPLDWVRAIHAARNLGASIRATWLGDGTQLAEMRREVEALGLTGVIDLPGFVTDRDRVIEVIRASDLMLFTHIEPESPRVLIEALMSACPIVGYDRPHPRDLISEHDGGVITPLADWQTLGKVLAGLSSDRERLVDLIRRASRDGSRFNSDIMTRDRSALIRERLGSRGASPA